MNRLRQVAKTGFVNTVGRLPYTGSIVDKLACWIRFSRWCVERGALVGQYDGLAQGRYEDRYRLYEAVIQRESLDQEALDFLEFGVYEGASIDWWARRISHPNARFVGFDTFTGLPEKWSAFPPKTFSTEGKPPEVDDQRCQFEAGLFQETVPDFLRRFTRRGRLVVHLDADLYSSTLFALTTMATILTTDDLLFFDEFAAPSHEFRAFEDFVIAYLVTYEVIGAANNFNRVCLKVKQVGTVPVEVGKGARARPKLK